MKHNNSSVINTIRNHVHPLTNNTTDLDPLLNRIGDASLVLLGEATHGTHEFYNLRAEISKRLIVEKGFTFIAIEGDWPDAYQVHRYIRSQTSYKKAQEALGEFMRFPAWMWRNHEMVAFIEWLKNHNKKTTMPIGFYGLDLYSLHRSMAIVINELEKIDPKAADRARRRYDCFDTFVDPQQYGYFATLYPSASCRAAVEAQLVELYKKERELFKHDHVQMSEEKQYIEQNARVVKNAEHYYRSMFEGDPAHSWNIRDQHMMETLESLMHFAHHAIQPPKGIVWAHNSHLGDARATQMLLAGELNLGQLVRERYKKQSFLLGFSTYTGTVSAASRWGGDVERKYVRPALEGSYETLFHEVSVPNFLLFPHDDEQVSAVLRQKRLERAIGVIYVPKTERESHYFEANLVEQFDAIIHSDTTHALEPLDKTAKWEEGELPETYPFGI